MLVFLPMALSSVWLWYRERLAVLFIHHWINGRTEFPFWTCWTNQPHWRHHQGWETEDTFVLVPCHYADWATAWCSLDCWGLLISNVFYLLPTPLRSTAMLATEDQLCYQDEIKSRLLSTFYYRNVGAINERTDGFIDKFQFILVWLDVCPASF